MPAPPHAYITNTTINVVLEVSNVLAKVWLIDALIMLTFLKARVKGDLRGCTLSVEIGAQFAGDLRIGPAEVPELQKLPAGPGDQG